MSGVPMPLSSRVAVPDGGKLAGIRTMRRANTVLLEHIPERLAVAQQLTRALESGNCQLPIVSVRRAGSVLVVDKYGTIVCWIAVDEIEDPVAARIQSQ